MKKNVILPMITILLISLFLISCSSTKQEKQIVIGASLLTIQDDFYITLNKGLKETASKFKDLNIKLISRNADLKLGKQLNDIDDFLQQGIDVLIISPVSPTAIGPTIDEVTRKGIPVITVDIKSEAGEIRTHIKSDDYGAGKLCAKFAAELINEKGKIGIITHPVLSSAINRVKGFREVLSQYPNIEIISELNAESRREKAMSLMEDMLVSHPDVDCVFGINDVMTLGAMASIEGAGRTDNVKAIMICGGQKEAFDRFEANDPCLKGAALVFPYQIGKKAIETAIDIIQKKDVPSEILIPVKLLTHENVTELKVEWGLK